MTSYRPYQHIERRKSRQIHVGRVPVGGDAPITVQTMTNTLTSDAAATIAQIRLAEMAGVDIVRVSCPDEESTAALAEIVREVNVPIVADIHFHYKRAIEAAQADAMVVAAYGLLLPQWVLDTMAAPSSTGQPRWGCLNIHASLLPRWRGAAPIHRAIEAGDTQTGITIMQMDAGLDTGGHPAGAGTGDRGRRQHGQPA